MMVSGTPIIADASLYNTTVTVPDGESATLRWTVTNTGPIDAECEEFDDASQGAIVEIDYTTQS